jgi:hypothetical protein
MINPMKKVLTETTSLLLFHILVLHTHDPDTKVKKHGQEFVVFVWDSELQATISIYSNNELEIVLYKTDIKVSDDAVLKTTWLDIGFIKLDSVTEVLNWCYLLAKTC